eukprot:CAMPEP_0184298452 /NCGR_PEP_ID=MMETSP1049-20130417/9258_1 /TAXON_ID=77928 /ORGANISM="Proteomonas sulcata, Strain CCMP704" /LENGTH=50 /DNA_ID=CAMNT_0026608589 /DNA_START=347 /DNA_END=499 /DNA_ORIENTATION=+
MEAATLEGLAGPGVVKTGTSPHSISTTVVWPLESGAEESRNKSMAVPSLR